MLGDVHDGVRLRYSTEVCVISPLALFRKRLRITKTAAFAKGGATGRSCGIAEFRVAAAVAGEAATGLDLRLAFLLTGLFTDCGSPELRNCVTAELRSSTTPHRRSAAAQRSS